jgi:hypothetical protein
MCVEFVVGVVDIFLLFYFLLERLDQKACGEDDPLITHHASVIHHNNLDQDTTSVNCSFSVGHLNKEQRLDLQVTQIPLNLLGKVCAMLDVEHPFFCDYRMFAENLGVDSLERIRVIGQRKEQTHSLLLEYKLSIKKFINILNKIEREDVIEVIESWLNQASTTDSR